MRAALCSAPCHLSTSVHSVNLCLSTPSAPPSGFLNRTLLLTSTCPPKSLPVVSPGSCPSVCHLCVALSPLGARPAPGCQLASLGSSWWRRCVCWSTAGRQRLGCRPDQTPMRRAVCICVYFVYVCCMSVYMLCVCCVSMCVLCVCVSVYVVCLCMCVVYMCCLLVCVLCIFTCGLCVGVSVRVCCVSVGCVSAYVVCLCVVCVCCVCLCMLCVSVCLLCVSLCTVCIRGDACALCSRTHCAQVLLPPASHFPRCDRAWVSLGRPSVWTLQPLPFLWPCCLGLRGTACCN